MSLDDYKEEFLKLVEQLYIHLFLPASSANPQSPVIRSLVVPDEGKIKARLRETLTALGEGAFKIKGHQGRDLKEVCQSATRTSQHHYGLPVKPWLACAGHFGVDRFHLSLIEQLLTVYNREFGLPKDHPVVIPKINVSDYSLEPFKHIPAEGKKILLEKENYDKIPPFWRWFWAVMPALEHGDTDNLFKNPTLEKILANLCIPVFPTTSRVTGKGVSLPLTNAMRMVILLGRVCPEKSQHDNAVRKVMAVNFVTFGRRDISVIGITDAYKSSRQLSGLLDKVSYAKSYIRKEANRVGTLYDKHFQKDHVYGVGTEDYFEAHRDLFPLDEHGYFSDPTFEAIKRTVDPGDPENDDDSYDSDSDVPLAPPGYYNQPGQYGMYESEAIDDPQEGDEDGEVSQEVPDGEGDDDNVNPQNGDTEDTTDDNQTPDDEQMPEGTIPPDPSENDTSGDVGQQQQNGDKEDQNKIDPTYKKIFKGKPFKASSDSNVSTYVYRLAVSNLNDALQNDPGPAVDRDVKDLLNSWCVDWLWISDPSETQKLLENKGLLKFLRP